MKARESKSIVIDSIGGDTIVINIETGSYYALTPAGAKCWKLATSANVEDCETNHLLALVAEGLLEIPTPLPGNPASPETVFDKYDDINSLLIADPIHEVDEQGWPKLR